MKRWKKISNGRKTRKWRKTEVREGGDRFRLKYKVKIFWLLLGALNTERSDHNPVLNELIVTLL